MKTTHILEINMPEKSEMHVSEVINCHDDGLCWFKVNYHLKKMKNDFITVKSTKHGKQELLENAVCFDIETTRIKTESGYHTYMYIWQVAFCDIVLTGRTWDEFHNFMNMIQEYYNLGETKSGKKTDTKECILWIANSGYEFQFICRHVFMNRQIVRNVFSDTMRKPITVDISYNDTDKGFKCLDVLRIGAISLKQLGKNYCITQKKTGDLDYTKIRNSKTELTETELQYCYNDVIILNEWNRFYINAYVRQVHFIPVTSTALIRKAVEQNYKKSKYSDNKLMSLHPENITEYIRVVMKLYRGGYTHANINLVGNIISNVAGMDFTSSYPAVMLQEKFPMTKFKHADITTELELEQFISEHKNEKCWYADFTFYGVQNLTTHSVESLHKIDEYNKLGKSEKQYINHYNAVIDNGRVLATNQMSVTLTDIDYDVYKKFYEWECFEISGFMYADYDYLPAYLTDVVKEMYKRKTVLKRQNLDDTLEYIRAKQFVNGIYGLTVQKLHFDNVIFDGNDWGYEFKTPEGKKQGVLTVGEINSNLQYYDDMYQGMLKKAIKNRLGMIVKYEAKIYLSAYWGVWVTAHARKRILDTICYLGSDCIYSDTDSVYFKNPDKYADYFRSWNSETESMNKKLFGKDFENLKEIGTFDSVLIAKKSDRYSFITYGAKRYIKYDSEYNIECTIAGLPKHTLQDTAKKQIGENATKKQVAEWITENFNETLNLDFLDSQKKTHDYLDTEYSDIVTDENGNTEIMHEYSGISIYEIPFSMTVSDMWLKLADRIQSENRERFIYED